MLADPDGVLDRAVGPGGGRRFYPPGAHPATHRLREHLFLMERLAERVPEPADETRASIAHIRDQLRAFELGEDRAKAIYILDHLDHLPERST